jgi:integrase
MVWCGRLPGFGCRIFPGKREFIYRFRARDGKQRVVRLGQFGPLTVEKARSMASDLYEQVRRGRDPVADLESEQVTNARAKAETALTFDALIEDWKALHLIPNRRPRYADEAVRAVRNGLPELLSQPAAQITPEEASNALHRIVKLGHGVTAARTRAYASACYSWAVKLRKVPSNPFAGLPTIGTPVVESERVLDDDELRAVWVATDALLYPFGPFYKLAILTLQRREQVAAMRWSEINLNKRLWTIPGSRMKKGKPHDVHLSEAACDVLRSLPRREGCDFVFTTGRRRGEDRDPAPISGFSDGKNYLDAAIALARGGEPIAAWRLHNLRHTGVTHLARLGVDSIVADKLLAHQPAKLRGVAGVYQRYGFERERAQALDAWAAHVIGTDAQENVVRLPVARQVSSA